MLRLRATVISITPSEVNNYESRCRARVRAGGRDTRPSTARDVSPEPFSTGPAVRGRPVRLVNDTRRPAMPHLPLTLGSEPTAAGEDFEIWEDATSVLTAETETEPRVGLSTPSEWFRGAASPSNVLALVDTPSATDEMLEPSVELPRLAPEVYEQTPRRNARRSVSQHVTISRAQVDGASELDEQRQELQPTRRLGSRIVSVANTDVAEHASDDDDSDEKSPNGASRRTRNATSRMKTEAVHSQVNIDAAGHQGRSRDVERSRDGMLPSRTLANENPASSFSHRGPPEVSAVSTSLDGSMTLPIRSTATRSIANVMAYAISVGDTDANGNNREELHAQATIAGAATTNTAMVPATPSRRRFAVYDDSIPASLQPQTPQNLPGAWHRSRIDGLLTAPMASQGWTRRAPSQTTTTTTTTTRRHGPIGGDEGETSRR